MSKPKTPGAQLRADVLKVYGKLGGPEYLRQLAELDPKLFSQFLLKMIPSESAVTGADGGPVSINVVTGWHGLQKIRSKRRRGTTKTNQQSKTYATEKRIIRKNDQRQHPA